MSVATVALEEWRASDLGSGVTGAVVVSADARSLTYDTVEGIAEWAARSGTEVGFTVEDQTAAPHAGDPARVGKVAYVRARSEVELLADGKALRGKQAARRLVDTQWDLLVLEGHGDGAHLNLGDHVLCGLVGEEEALAGRAVIGGCHRRGDGVDCKKSRRLPLVPVLAAGLRVRVMVLLSCNSFVLDGSRYPSDSSLVRAILASGAQGVIATTRAVVIDDDLGAWVVSSLSRGARLGTVVNLLNARELSRNEPAGYVLVGRPDLRVTDADPPLDPSPPPSDGTVRPSRRDRWAERSRLVRAMEQLDVALRIDGREANVEDLRRVIAARQRAQLRVWEAAKVIANPARDPERALESIDAAFREAADMWTDAMAAYAFEHVFLRTDDETIRLRDLFHLFHRIDSVAERGHCGRCGNAQRVLRYVDPVLGMPDRTVVECSGCGPFAENGSFEADVAVDCDPRRGTGLLEISLRGLEGSTPAPSHVMLYVRDKSQAAPVVADQFGGGPSDSFFARTFPIDQDSGSDFWTVQVAVFRHGDFAYARRLITPVMYVR